MQLFAKARSGPGQWIGFVWMGSGRGGGANHDVIRIDILWLVDGISDSAGDGFGFGWRNGRMRPHPGRRPASPNLRALIGYGCDQRGRVAVQAEGKRSAAKVR